jgi:hypothetical protein
VLENLESYLETAASPQLRDLVMDACKTLETAGVDQHLFMLNVVLEQVESTESDILTLGICGTLIPVMTQTLREFGIQLTEDADLRVVNSILKGLQAISNWDDPDTLNGLTQAVEGEEAALADILSIVGDLTVGDYMQVLLEVSPDLLDRIAQETDRATFEPQPDSVAVAAAQIRLRTLLPKAQFNEDSIFVYALDNGLRLGLPFELCLAPYLEALYSHPIEKLGQELVAFAYASSLTTDAVLPVINKLKETFTLSIDDMFQLDAAIKRLL